MSPFTESTISQQTLMQPTKQISVKHPEVTTMYPTEGIEAGGTVITIEGKNLIPKLAVMIGTHPTDRMGLCSSSSCTFISSPVAGSYRDQELPVLLQLEDSELVEIPFKFTYRPNPSLEKVYPLETLVTGGNTLTVEGMFGIMSYIIQHYDRTSLLRCIIFCNFLTIIIYCFSRVVFSQRYFCSCWY